MSAVVIESRFNGPPGSANGGYAAGLIGQHVSGAATVTLRRPPPLDRPLTLEVDGGQGARLLDGDTLIGDAVSAPTSDLPALPLEVDVDSAHRAAARYVGFDHTPFPTCWVCGPDRPDGLRIFPGAVAPGGSTPVAAPWIPTVDLADVAGTVSEPHVWAALDCPSYFALGEPVLALLGRLTVAHHAPVPVGEALAVVGWVARPAEGRKHHSAAAIVDGAGQVLATGSAVWIELSPEQFASHVD
jgi:hypothetical protein